MEHTFKCQHQRRIDLDFLQEQILLGVKGKTVWENQQWQEEFILNPTTNDTDVLNITFWTEMIQ